MNTSPPAPMPGRALVRNPLREKTDLLIEAARRWAAEQAGIAALTVERVIVVLEESVTGAAIEAAARDLDDLTRIMRDDKPWVRQPLPGAGELTRQVVADFAQPLITPGASRAVWDGDVLIRFPQLTAADVRVDCAEQVEEALQRQRVRAGAGNDRGTELSL